MQNVQYFISNAFENDYNLDQLLLISNLLSVSSYERIKRSVKIKKIMSSEELI